VGLELVERGLDLPSLRVRGSEFGGGGLAVVED
jgi:hypothetical protein